MACTPQQIEAKRKLALQKLQAKKIKFSPDRPPPPTVKTVQPLQQTNTNYSGVQKNNQQYSSSPNKFNFISKWNQAQYRTNNFRSSLPQKNLSTEQFVGQNIIKATTSLISDDRFEITMPFHIKTIEIFKTIPSRRYNAENKNWNFSVDEIELLMSKLQSLQPDVTVERMPKYVLNLIKNTNKCNKVAYNQYNLEKIEPELLNILMPFQREGVCFGIQHLGRCLIADDMGLGKTIQALAIASYYRTDWPLLIVTTASMKNTWEETIHKYLPSVPLACIRYMTTGKDYIGDAEILIVSHDMMTRATDKLLERGFKFLIIDESHIIKNFKTKCTKNAIALAKKMRRVVLLSGTPALSRPNELYSQLSVIDDKFFGNFFEFSKRYCDGKDGPFGWDSSGKSNLAELEIILTKKFLIRRTKTEVLGSLPGKNREIIKLDIGLNHLTDTDRLCFSQMIDNYVVKRAREKHTALLQLFAETAKIKIPSVCLYLEEIIKYGQKFLVFAHHQVMLDALCSVLNKKKQIFVRIDGNTTSEQRKYFIDKFQLKDECIAAVLSITAANAGITLTAAQLVVFAELHWNPSVRDEQFLSLPPILTQAESRAHRIGQSGIVNVRYLLGEGTADDHIWPLLQSKQNVLNEVGLCIDSFKDAGVSDQIIPSTSGLSRTIAGTNDIANFMIKDSQNNSTEEEKDMLEKFYNDGNDDIFVNADIDF